MRKRCPTCYQGWPAGKDPVEEDAKTLMSLRIGDIVKGLSSHSVSVEAHVFDKGGDIDAACQRLMEIEEAEYLIQRALDKVQDAKRNLASTPLVMGLIDKVLADPDELVADGMVNWPAIRTGRYRVIAAAGVLRVQELEEVEDDN